MHIDRPDGARIHFEARGAGAPLLLLPGFGLDRHVFDRFSIHVERRFACVAVDNRGAGDSDAPRGPYAIRTLAEDAAAVIDALGGGPAFVVGHSMGGFIALELALALPQKVRGLLLLSTAASGKAARDGRPQDVDAAFARRHGTAEEIAREILAACLTPEFLEARPDDFDRFVAGRLAHPPSGRGLAGQRAAADAFDATSRLRDLGVPATVVHGDADRVISLARGEELADGIESAPLRILSGVGHMPFWEAPAELARIAVDAFSETSAK